MMGRLIRRLQVRHAGSRRTAPGFRALAVRSAAGCSAIVLLGAGAYARTVQPAPGGSGTAPSAPAATRQAASFGQIILPDLLIVAPSGLTSQQLTRLSKITGVRNMIAFDGAEIKADDRAVSVIGVNPSQFRSWVPLQTASDQPFWTALASGQFVASKAARTALGLRRGTRYQLTGSTRQTVTFGAAASLGIDGVDLLVDTALSRELGLVHQVAALISAPGDDLATLIAKVKAVLGPSGKIVGLRQQQLPAAPAAPATPTTPAPSGQLPTTYLQLFQESAAEYCPGLSWTVLAAIGQIESADGTNMGPSSAGALGPMQFLPSTWAAWGIVAFGQSGPPDIMNPYDAVPSAARMLCADGAASGGSGLSAAIFDYNHATWYVNEVLGLAAEYARDFP
jgi:Transglycosylase SLT domain